MDKERRIKQLEADKEAAESCEREATQDFKKHITRITNMILFYLEGGASVGETVHHIDKIMIDVRKDERTIDSAGWIIRKYRDLLDVLKEEG